MVVYKKERDDWYHNVKELVISLDKLDFGWFMEIEGEEEQILNFEDEFTLINLKEIVETKSYPTLTREFEQ